MITGLQRDKQREGTSKGCCTVNDMASWNVSSLLSFLFLPSFNTFPDRLLRTFSQRSVELPLLNPVEGEKTELVLVKAARSINVASDIQSRASGDSSKIPRGLLCFQEEGKHAKFYEVNNVSHSLVGFKIQSITVVFKLVILLSGQARIQHSLTQFWLVNLDLIKNTDPIWMWPQSYYIRENRNLHWECKWLTLQINWNRLIYI